MEKKRGSQDRKGSKPRAAGKSHSKIVAYYASGCLAKKKIRRVLRSNGTERAKAYAKNKDQAKFFNDLEKSGLVARVEADRARRRARRGVARKCRRQTARQAQTA